MKLEKLVSFIACLECKGELGVKKGKLKCNLCGAEYFIKKGVPILLNEEEFNRQERKQIEIFKRHYERDKGKSKLEKWRESMIKRVFDKFYDKRMKSYLDIGCGEEGYLVIEGGRRGLTCMGVDISVRAVLRAKRKAEKERVLDNCGFLVCSAEKLPFKRDLFDYASCVSVLEHVENDGLVIRKVYEILRKKGLFYICAPNSYEKMLFFWRPVYKFIDKRVGHKRHYLKKDLDRKMEKEGFFKVDYFYNGHLIKIWQLFLEKIGLISDKKWWRMEEKDINKNENGLQLNVVYKKK